MKRTWLRGALFAASMACTGAAFAGVGDVMSTTVTPLQSTVTYRIDNASPPLVTFLGYRVSITNIGTNTSNNVTFVASTSVSSASATPSSGETAPFFESDGLACVTTSADATAISCVAGQLKSGESVSFAVFFKAPTQRVTCPSTNPACDTVSLTGVTYYAETINGGTPSPQNSSELWTPPPVVALGTSNPTRIKSALPKSGGTFYTGSAGDPGTTVPFGTFVNVPAVPQTSYAQVASIDLNAIGSGNPNFNTCASYANFYTCYASALSIPGVDYSGTPNALTIVLRVGPSDIQTGTKIGNVVLSYTSDTVTNYVVPACVNGAPQPGGLPCVLQRIAYKKSDPLLPGVFEFQLLNLKNGSYSVF